MNIDLEGRTALVTGGGSGLGRSAATYFSSAGANVVVADLPGRGAKETVATIEAAGGRAIAVDVDVTVDAQVEAMLKRTVETFGGLHCAMNSAGTTTSSRTSTHDFDRAEFERVLTVNLTGTWLCMKHQIGQMLQNDGGAIVNLSSIYGLVGAAGTAAYTASKHGVAGLTKTAAIDYARQGIRVNAISPGYIRTPMVQGVLDVQPELEKWMASRTPMGRIGSPEEIGQVAVWLCSDAAAYVNGLIMPVDGGLTSQ